MDNHNKLCIAVLLVLSIAWTAHAQVNCTAQGPGRHPEPADATCQNYTYCVLNANTGTYLSYNYTCPTTSVFNPATSQCTAATNYVCPGATTAAGANATACTAEGFIADPTSTDCSSYLQCVQINGTFDQTTLDCPPGTFYDPSTTFCDPNYVCGFNCTAVGRFPNNADTTCQSYYYCVLAANATLIQYEYTCPTVSVFNPTTAMCTTAYVCPTS